jgi:hypothetical protein
MSRKTQALVLITVVGVVAGGTIALDVFVVESADAANGVVRLDQADGPIAVTEIAAPSQARFGDTVQVGAVLENVGTETVTRTVAFVMAGTRYGRRTVTLDPGERRRIAFEQDTMGIGLEPGQYYTGVLAGARGDMHPLQLVAGYDVDDVDAPETVTAGERFTIRANVRNYNDFRDEQLLQYRLDGDVYAERRLALGDDASTNVSFRIDTTGVEPGTYVHGFTANGTGSHASITVRPNGG